MQDHSVHLPPARVPNFGPPRTDCPRTVIVLSRCRETSKQNLQFHRTAGKVHKGPRAAPEISHCLPPKKHIFNFPTDQPPPAGTGATTAQRWCKFKSPGLVGEVRGARLRCGVTVANLSNNTSQNAPTEREKPEVMATELPQIFLQGTYVAVTGKSA